MINKKAQGHVEVMLSFVIFIGFLIFTFVFLNPFARTKEPSYIMDNAQKAIIGYISDDVGKLSIITNGTSCYQFAAEDYNTNYKEVDERNGKYIIYFNKIFDNSSTKKDGCPLNYTLGVYSKEKMIIYNKILTLKNNYSDYDNLKISLGITDDFLFTVRDLVGNPITELSVSRNIPQGIDVESRDIPIRVINSAGQIQEFILNIRVW